MTTIHASRALSPKSLTALRKPLARQVFRVSNYDEEHGRRSFVIQADGTWVYDNTLRRGELGQGKMVLKEEQDAREEAQKHIQYLQEIISKFPRLHAAFADAPLLPQGLRFDRAERLIVIKNDTTEAASNPLWHWRVHYLLKFRPSGTEDYVPVEGGRCHIDLAPHGMILGAASGILPFQPGPSISKRFTVLHEVPVVEDAATLAAPILAKGQNVNKAPDSLQLDTNGNEVKDLRQVDGVYAYNAESGCYAYNYLGLEGKVPGCGEAVGQEENESPQTSNFEELEVIDYELIADIVNLESTKNKSSSSVIFLMLMKLSLEIKNIKTLAKVYKKKFGTIIENDIALFLSGEELYFARELLVANPQKYLILSGNLFYHASNLLDLLPDTSAKYNQMKPDEKSLVVLASIYLGNKQKESLIKIYIHSRGINDIYEQLRISKFSHTEIGICLLQKRLYHYHNVFKTFTSTSRPLKDNVPGGVINIEFGVTIDPNRKIAQDMYAAQYQGAMADDTHWLQFIWRELEYDKIDPANPANVIVNKDATQVSGYNYKHTTNPQFPEYHIDGDPFYENTYFRDQFEIVMFDRPSVPTDYIKLLFLQGATTVRARANFDLFLVRDCYLLYHIQLTASWLFLASPVLSYENYPGQYSISSSKKMSFTDRLPTVLKDLLIKKFPNTSYII